MLKIALLSLLPVLCFGQKEKLSPTEYIDKYKHLAVNEMACSGNPASVKLAQAIVESGYGSGKLAREANNHFGIK